jgi:hypothetical protein
MRAAASAGKEALDEIERREGHDPDDEDAQVLALHAGYRVATRVRSRASAEAR